MLIYARTSSGKRKKSKSRRLLQAQEEHKKFLESVGYTKRRKPVVSFPDLSVENADNVGRLSNHIPGAGGYKRSVDDYKWKRDVVESESTIAEIERKKLRVAPAYNKGATQYITDGADLKTLGRKV